jgi:hypothetical protein
MGMLIYRITPFQRFKWKIQKEQIIQKRQNGVAEKD